MRYCTTCQGRYPVDLLHCPKDQTQLKPIDEFTPGKIIRDKYEILGCIGSGGMAVVYRARHIAFKEEVALKVVSSRLLSDELFLKRFRSEAIITRKLNHPNAVHVMDLDSTEEGCPFIVMELVQGTSLRGVLRHQGHLAVTRALEIASQIAAALGAAHDLGIIHRDIKPDNILLVPQASGKDLVKVLDFGIARIRDARNQGLEQTDTHTGMVMGTPQYLSPEQAIGAKGDDIDGRADIYALGLVLYEMLTGVQPFQAENSIGMLVHHIHTVPQPPHLRKPELGISPMISAAVMKALEKDRKLRFSDAAEFINALKFPDEWSRTAVLGSDSVAALTGKQPKPIQRIQRIQPGDSTHRDEDAAWLLGKLASGADALALQEQYEQSQKMAPATAVPPPPPPAAAPSRVPPPQSPRPSGGPIPAPPRPKVVDRAPIARPQPQPLKPAIPSVAEAARRSGMEAIPETVFQEGVQKRSTAWNFDVPWRNWLTAAALGIVLMVIIHMVMSRGLNVQPTNAIESNRPSDADLAMNVKSAISESGPLHGQPITVQVKNSVVTLSGRVDVAYKYDLAQQIAGRVAGISSVENRLEIRESSDAPRSVSHPATTAGLDGQHLGMEGVAAQMNVQELIAAGNRALAAGNNRLALEDFKRAAAINPDNTEAQAGIMKAMGKN